MSQPSRRVCDLVDERDDRRCICCGVSLMGVPASRHHRHMRSHPFPGLHEASNLILLCGSGTTGCHGFIHAHPEFAYAQGWLLHSWEEHPDRVPVNTFAHGWVLLDDRGGWKSYEKEQE